MINLTGMKEAGIAKSNDNDEAVGNNVDNDETIDDTAEEQSGTTPQSLLDNMNWKYFQLKFYLNHHPLVKVCKPWKMLLRWWSCWREVIRRILEGEGWRRQSITWEM